MRLLDSQQQVDRNRRKFFMKYGFDIIKYTDMTVIGNTDEEILQEMNIYSSQLEHFRKNIRLTKLKQQMLH